MTLASNRLLAILFAGKRANRVVEDQSPKGTLLIDRRGTGKDAGPQTEIQNYVAAQI
jgi:hypothetical protein